MSKTLLSSFRAKTYTAAEEMTLVGEWVLNGNARAREDLILSVIPMIIKIAKRYPLRSGLVEYGDLINVGVMGVSSALKNFDPSKGIRFSAYAKMFIVSAINTFVIDNCDFAIGKIATTKQMRRVFWRVRRESNGGVLPDDKILDIATETGIPFEQIKEIHERICAVKVDVADMQDSESTHQCTSDIVLEEDWACKTSEAVAQSISKLDERKEKIISELYLTEKPRTKTAIANDLGLSVERVRQLEKQALSFIKEDISNVTRFL